VARIVGAIGAFVIYRLIALFGRRCRWRDVPWLAGPLGEAVIGDAPYLAVAAREGLTVERHARDGGLVPDFALLQSARCDPGRLHAAIRDFYEHTAAYAMDVWSQTYFPASIGLWLLVTTISRQVNQLNFPLSPLETALGMTSEIITMRRPEGSIRYTGWFRTLAGAARVLYTGFYMVERVPAEAGPCVKVVFPMPHGNATVVLRPTIGEDGSLVLESSGGRFGGAGFYRVDARGEEAARVWLVRTLHERFHVFVDARRA
jgi:hypothetical protein